MTPFHPGIAFRVFHITLALGLLAMGVTALRYILPELDDAGHGHLALVAGAEAVGAILLLIPRTVRWGGAILLVVLLPSFLNEAMHGDWEFAYLMYAAGVWLVMAHGATATR